jgi:hypothetical protein
LSIAFRFLLILIVVVPGLAWVNNPLVEYGVILFTAVIFAAVGIAASSVDIVDAAEICRRFIFVATLPLAWMIIQAFPNPIGPASHPIWGSAATALQQSLLGHITIDIASTIRSIFRFVANVALVVATLILTRDRRRAEVVLLVLCLAAVLAAIQLIFNRLVLPESVEPAGSFALSGLGILLTLSASFALQSRVRREKRGGAHVLIFCLAGLVVCLLALFSTNLLNSIVTSLGAAMIFLIVVIRALNLSLWTVRSLCFSFVVATLLVGAFVYEHRFSASAGPWPTAIILRDGEIVQRMIADVGWFGSGAGTFWSLAKIYQEFDRSLDPVASAVKIAVELGWPAAVVLMCSVVYLIVFLFRGALSRGRDYLFPAAASACIIYLLFDAFFDPNLLSPAVLIFADVILGFGLAQSVGQNIRSRRS